MRIIPNCCVHCSLCLGQVRLGVLGFWKSRSEINEEMAMEKQEMEMEKRSIYRRIDGREEEEEENYLAGKKKEKKKS